MKSHQVGEQVLWLFTIKQRESRQCFWVIHLLNTLNKVTEALLSLFPLFPHIGHYLLGILLFHYLNIASFGGENSISSIHHHSIYLWL